ncbi:MAG: hypothetical protein JNK78_13610 [Planctomycetes bacterium]|nr:hypothetical protein [Planctomycetota bacterium]
MLRSTSLLTFLCAAVVTALPLAAATAPHPVQSPETQQDPQRPPDARAPQDGQAPRELDATMLEALDHLAAQMRDQRSIRARAAAQNDAAGAAAADDRLRELDWQFAGLVSRLDVQNFEAPRAHEFDLRAEVEDLVRPLLDAIKAATAEPRQIAELTARIDLLQQRKRVAEEARRTTERALRALPAGHAARPEAERELRDRWRPTIDRLQGEIVVLQAQLAARTEGRGSLVEAVGGAIRDFVLTSGTSLLLAVVTFVAVFTGLRFLLARLLRRRSTNRAFSLRLFEVVLQILSVVLATAATLVVPYARDDWLLLAVCIVFLVGVGWVLVRMLPQFFEQVRLVLNVGGVREGERILVDGLPYRVDTLRLYTRLENPDLQGGVLRVPIQSLIGKRSRRPGDGEPWFPCRVGDHVLLADGTCGPVRAQTPEVVVVESHGAPRSYATQAFLEQTPRNLSSGFVVASTIGIDYRHQKEAVTVVPERLRDALRQGLAANTAPGELVDVKVELQGAGSSSIDFIALARFSGVAAGRFLELQRRIQATLVAACLQHGFVIPFPQITVHDARA